MSSCEGSANKSAGAEGGAGVSLSEPQLQKWGFKKPRCAVRDRLSSRCGAGGAQTRASLGVSAVLSPRF